MNTPKHPALVHDTVVVERTYPAGRARVFRAWADVDQRRRWHFPGDDGWTLLEMHQDFQVGGIERFRFRPDGEAELRSEGRFLDIVENERIVSAGTMHRGDVRISVTLCSVELSDADGGTHVRLTDQSAFLDGRETPEDRRSGWGEVFERLRKVLA